MIGTMTDEFAYLATVGLLNGGVGSGSLMELLLFETDNDKRRCGINDGSINGAFQMNVRRNSAFGYYVDRATIATCWEYIAERFRNPHIRTDIPPKPSNVTVTDGVISADNPGEGYSLYLFSWNYVTFAEVGLLSEHSAPGAGVYVVVTKADSGGYGLPSGFVEVT